MLALMRGCESFLKDGGGATAQIFSFMVFYLGWICAVPFEATRGGLNVRSDLITSANERRTYIYPKGIYSVLTI